MDWMLEGLLQGTQFQTLYNRKIESLREEYHLRKIDIDILYFLYKSGENNTSKDICSLNLFNKGHISQSVDRMVKQQLIHTVQDEEDRRCVHLVLTEEAVGIIGRAIAGADVQHDIKWRNGGGAAGAAPGFQKSEPEYQGSVTEFLEFLKGLRL